MDLLAPAKSNVQTEWEHWPKCFRCSRALDRPYPVEHFGVYGREQPKTATGLYELVLDVKCSHGEARRMELESRSNGKLKKWLWGLGGGMGLVNYSTESEQRVRLEIPRRWGGIELADGSYQASAIEQLACSRVYCFAPGGRTGQHGVIYMPGSIARKHGLETQVR